MGCGGSELFDSSMCEIIRELDDDGLNAFLATLEGAGIIAAYYCLGVIEDAGDTGEAA